MSIGFSAGCRRVRVSTFTELSSAYLKPLCGRLPVSGDAARLDSLCCVPSNLAIMINAVLVFNNAGQPRLTKFYTQLASRSLIRLTAEVHGASTYKANMLYRILVYSNVS